MRYGLTDIAEIMLTDSHQKSYFYLVPPGWSLGQKQVEDKEVIYKLIAKNNKLLRMAAAFLLGLVKRCQSIISVYD